MLAILANKENTQRENDFCRFAHISGTELFYIQMETTFILLPFDNCMQWQRINIEQLFSILAPMAELGKGRELCPEQLHHCTQRKYSVYKVLDCKQLNNCFNKLPESLHLSVMELSIRACIA